MIGVILDATRGGAIVHVGVTVAMAVVLLFFALMGDTAYSRSSQGVMLVGDTVAHIKEGDRLSLKEVSSKRTSYWRIELYDDTVYFAAQELRLTDINQSYTLCGIDCTVETELGSPVHVTLTERSDGGVDVEWPSGPQWHFREY